jgi:hypothetical protein
MSPRTLDGLRVLFDTDERLNGFGEGIDLLPKLINDGLQIILRFRLRILWYHGRNLLRIGSRFLGFRDDIVVWLLVVIFGCHYFIPFVEYFLRPVKNHQIARGIRMDAMKNCLSAVSMC